MNPEQQNQKPIDPTFIVQAQREEINGLMNDLLMWKAYAKQLEAQIAQQPQVETKPNTPEE